MASEIKSATINTVYDLLQFLSSIQEEANPRQITFANPINLTLLSENEPDGSLSYRILTSMAPSMFRFDDGDKNMGDENRS